MIPIIIGVTGHRDIPEKYVPKLEVAISKRLDELLIEYPNSQFIVLSGAAAGADTLVANIALKKDRISHVAILPFELKEYQKDFAKPDEKANFENIIGKSSQTISVPKASKLKKRDDGYELVGRYIVDRAQILFCLWDGVFQQKNENGKWEVLQGGTANVKQIALSGRKHLDILAAHEPLQIEHLLTPRLRNNTEWFTNNTSQIARWQNVDGGNSWKPILGRIDEFNSRSNNLDKSSMEISKSYLFGDKKPASTKNNIDQLTNIYAAADILASKHQGWRKRGIYWITILSFLAVLSLQIFEGFSQTSIWMIGYFGFAVSAFIIYWLLFKSTNQHEEKYLDWRSLAECLRVEVFWTMVGVNASASDYYLTEDTDELAWLKTAVRNSEPLDMNLEYDKDGVNLCKEIWLTGQLNYYKTKADEAHTQDKKFERYGFLAVICTILSIAAMTVTHFLNFDANWVALSGFFSAISLLILATIKGYSYQMAYGDLANRYKATVNIKRQALKRLENVSHGNEDQTLAILLAAGIHALYENSSWLRTHRSRKFEVNIT